MVLKTTADKWQKPPDSTALAKDTERKAHVSKYICTALEQNHHQSRSRPVSLGATLIPADELSGLSAAACERFPCFRTLSSLLFSCEFLGRLNLAGPEDVDQYLTENNMQEVKERNRTLHQ